MSVEFGIDASQATAGANQFDAAADKIVAAITDISINLGNLQQRLTSLGSIGNALNALAAAQQRVATTSQSAADQTAQANQRIAASSQAAADQTVRSGERTVASRRRERDATEEAIKGYEKYLSSVDKLGRSQAAESRQERLLAAAQGEQVDKLAQLTRLKEQSTVASARATRAHVEAAAASTKASGSELQLQKDLAAAQQRNQQLFAQLDAQKVASQNAATRAQITAVHESIRASNSFIKTLGEEGQAFVRNQQQAIAYARALGLAVDKQKQLEQARAFIRERVTPTFTGGQGGGATPPPGDNAAGVERQIRAGLQLLAQKGELNKVLVEQIREEQLLAAAFGKETDAVGTLARVTERLNQVRGTATATQTRMQQQQLRDGLAILAQLSGENGVWAANEQVRLRVARATGNQIAQDRIHAETMRRVNALTKEQITELSGLHQAAGRAGGGVGQLTSAFAVLSFGPLSGIGARMLALQSAFTTIGTSIAAGASTGLLAGLLGVGAALATIAIGAGVATKVVEVSRAFQRVESSLRVGTGSAYEAGKALEFIRSESDRLGLPLREAATQFGKLAAAARGTALEGEPVRKIFSAVSEAGVALRLSSEQLGGALNAIQQIISKGTVSSEELRGQLAERIPGAMGLAARAAGKTSEEFSKLLETGKVLAVDLLPNLAIELHRMFGTEAERAAAGLEGQINRLGNAFEELFVNAGQGGFVDSFTRSIEKITEAVQDPEFQEGLTLFATMIGKVLEFSVEHLNLVAKGFFYAGAAVLYFTGALGELPEGGLPGLLEQTVDAHKHRDALVELSAAQEVLNATLEAGAKNPATAPKLVTAHFEETLVRVREQIEELNQQPLTDETSNRLFELTSRANEAEQSLQKLIAAKLTETETEHTARIAQEAGAAAIRKINAQLDEQVAAEEKFKALKEEIIAQYAKSLGITARTLEQHEEENRLIALAAKNTIDKTDAGKLHVKMMQDELRLFTRQSVALQELDENLGKLALSRKEENAASARRLIDVERETDILNRQRLARDQGPAAVHALEAQLRAESEIQRQNLERQHQRDTLLAVAEEFDFRQRKLLDEFKLKVRLREADADVAKGVTTPEVAIQTATAATNATLQESARRILEQLALVKNLSKEEEALVYALYARSEAAKAANDVTDDHVRAMKDELRMFAEQSEALKELDGKLQELAQTRTEQNAASERRITDIERETSILERQRAAMSQGPQAVARLEAELRIEEEVQRINLERQHQREALEAVRREFTLKQQLLLDEFALKVQLRKAEEDVAKGIKTPEEAIAVARAATQATIDEANRRIDEHKKGIEDLKDFEIERIRDVIEAHESAKAALTLERSAQERIQRAYEEPFKNAAKNIQKAFGDTVTRMLDDAFGKSEGFWGDMLDLAKRFAAEMLVLNVFGPAFGEIGAGGGAGGLGRLIGLGGGPGSAPNPQTAATTTTLSAVNDSLKSLGIGISALPNSVEVGAAAGTQEGTQLGLEALRTIQMGGGGGSVLNGFFGGESLSSIFGVGQGIQSGLTKTGTGALLVGLDGETEEALAAAVGLSVNDGTESGFSAAFSKIGSLLGLGGGGGGSGFGGGGGGGGGLLGLLSSGATGALLGVGLGGSIGKLLDGVLGIDETLGAILGGIAGVGIGAGAAIGAAGGGVAIGGSAVGLAGGAAGALTGAAAGLSVVAWPLAIAYTGYQHYQAANTLYDWQQDDVNPLTSRIYGKNRWTTASRGASEGLAMGGALGFLLGGAIGAARYDRPPRVGFGFETGAPGTGVVDTPFGSLSPNYQHGLTNDSLLQSIAGLDRSIATALKPAEIASAAARLQENTGIQTIQQRPKHFDFAVTQLLQSRVGEIFGAIETEDFASKFRSQQILNTADLAHNIESFINARAQFHADLRTLSGEDIPQFEVALGQISQAFAGARENALAYGLDVEKVNAAFEAGKAKIGADFGDALQLRLLARTDPLAALLVQQQKEADRLLAEARAIDAALGLHTIVAAEREAAADRLSILEQFAKQANAALLALLDQLDTGDLGGLSPTAQLAATRETFERERAEAFANPAIPQERQEAAAAAQAWLEALRVVQAGGPIFGAGVSEVRAMIAALLATPLTADSTAQAAIDALLAATAATATTNQPVGEGTPSELAAGGASMAGSALLAGGPVALVADVATAPLQQAQLDALQAGNAIRERLLERIAEFGVPEPIVAAPADAAPGAAADSDSVVAISDPETRQLLQSMLESLQGGEGASRDSFDQLLRMTTTLQAMVGQIEALSGRILHLEASR